MVHRRAVRAVLLGAFALELCACPSSPLCLTGDEPSCDGGALLPDYCNTRAEADSDPTHCQLTLGSRLTCLDDAGVISPDCYLYISTLADGGADTDWYRAHMPSTLSSRSLLHVNAGYQGVTSTGVNFQVNVLGPGADGGLTSLATGADVHGTSAPKSVDLVVPFAQSNADVYLLVGAQANGVAISVDNRNPYSVLAEVMDNPDPNEPNNTLATATNVPLAAGNGGLEGTTSGYLATDNDVDYYSFTVPSSTGRQIIYLHITGPNPPNTNPPPAFGRLTYTLSDPIGNAISEGTMLTEFLAIDLATARLAATPGAYSLVVKGFKDANSTATVKGDLRVRYDVDLRILPDLDTNEPNDTIAQAKAVSFSGFGTKTLTGKLSYVQDEEWFAISLPAQAGASTLRYRTSVSTAAGRFAPLTPTASRQARVMEPVTTGTTSQDRQNACLTNAVACPKGYTDSTGPDGLLVAAICKASDPPQCLYAERDETAKFDNLKNLVGAIPVDPGKATTVYLMFRDQGTATANFTPAKYADDRDWTIVVDWTDDPDRTARLASGPTVLSVGGTTVSSSGQLTFGYGNLLNNFDDTNGQGIRAVNDYDAFATDKDVYQVNLPAAGVQSWAVSWDIQHGDGGVPPGELALELAYCGASGPGKLCPGELDLIFGYSSNSLSPWYQPNNVSTAVPLFSRVDGPTSTTITALGVGCECIGASHAAAGHFFISVGAANRVTNEPIVYTLHQSIAPYPTPATCPVVDAGCGFDVQPP
jgi:hypothetical protein